jgi:hypothetical protein
MINLDPILIQFISQNWFSLSLILGILKIIAKLTPSVVDDSIIELISEMFSKSRYRDRSELDKTI